MEISSKHIEEYNQIVISNKKSIAILYNAGRFPEAVLRVKIEPFSPEEFSNLSNLCRTQDAKYIDDRVKKFSERWLLFKHNILNYDLLKINNKNDSLVRKIASCLEEDELNFQAPVFFAMLKNYPCFQDIRGKDYGAIIVPYEKHGLKWPLEISVLENDIRLLFD